MAALLALATPARAAFPGANGKIAFENGHYDPNYEGFPSHYALFTISPNGGNRTLVADDNAGNGLWSPDGDRLAFQSDLLVGCCYSYQPIEVINADGSGRMRLTHPPGSVEGTTHLGDWSPDGSRIAFTAEVDEALPEVFTIRPDASDRAKLTDCAGRCIVFQPRWSPNGEQIAFAYSIDQVAGIAIVNADGTGERFLTSTVDEAVSSPAWSPDGATIAFVRGSQVYKVNADGSEETQLTHIPDRPFDLFWFKNTLSWSPNGDELLFGRGGDVYTMDRDGERVLNLTENGRSGAPVWSPDGQKIAFSIGQALPITDDAGDGVYIMNADGSERTQVTSSPAGFDLPTDWQAIPFKNPSKKCKSSPGAYRNHGQCVKASH